MSIEAEKSAVAAGEPAADVKAGGPRSRLDPEEEATTVWGKADLFEGSEEAEEEEEPLFRESFAAPEVAAPEVVTGPVRLLDDVPGDAEAPLPSADEANSAEPTEDDAPAVAEDDGLSTVEMTAEQVAALAAASLGADSAAVAGQVQGRAGEGPTEEAGPLVQLSGAEAEAARELAEREAAQHDPDPTRVVKANMTRLSCECRMCGRKVGTPRTRRFRGSLRSEVGFRCDICSNVFCATHVVRISGLFESLLKQGRFRCQLCQLEASKP